ncbi:nitrite/sulfite reductase [Bacillus tianshenii]|nr:nitrite/sulfite reductase [Bacillus tianshenii]
MAYEKIWANNEKLNKNEKAKLEKDGLEILNDIPGYAEKGFSSIPKDQWDFFKWAGLYLQKPKEDGYFMMRVNVPSGILNNEQLKTLAGISKDFGRNVFDITTRQAIQFHWLEIEEIPEIFRRLEAVGLSSVGACGDITRNITGNPLAGIDPDELYDTREIVEDIYQYFQNNPEFSNLPRKFKMSINTNTYNAANAEINCVAFVPAKKVIDGEEKIGFHVKVGGGLSSKPYLAQTLNVFLEPERVKEVAIAVATIFRDYGYRDKRHRARLKFLVADWGPETFTEKLREYVKGLPEQGTEETHGWNGGYFYGTSKQRQPGLNYIGFNVPVGRLDADEVFEIARIAEKYGNGEVRTCNSQNLIISNVSDEHVDDLLAEKVFERITTEPNKIMAYSVSCTGTEYCNLALTETKERMRRLAEYLDTKVELDVPVRLHMVGCPNSCGQRQIADIGFQGVKMKSKEKGMIEAFELYVGGTLLNGGEYNKKLKGKIDGEHLPDVTVKFIEKFKESKQEGEHFYDYVHRVGIDVLQSDLDAILA